MRSVAGRKIRADRENLKPPTGAGFSSLAIYRPPPPRASASAGLATTSPIATTSPLTTDETSLCELRRARFNAEFSCRSLLP